MKEEIKSILSVVFFVIVLVAAFITVNRILGPSSKIIQANDCTILIISKDIKEVK